MAAPPRRPPRVPPETQATPAKGWEVIFHDEFEPEFEALDPDVQLELAAALRAVELVGPTAGRPHVDTLEGSKHDNMKELRFKAQNGVEIWRAAFAFDPQRKACVLVAEDKQGKKESAFYRRLIRIADKRFDAHLKALDNSKKERS